MMSCNDGADGGAALLWLIEIAVYKDKQTGKQEAPHTLYSIDVMVLIAKIVSV